MTISNIPVWQTILGKHAPELLKQAMGLSDTIMRDGALSARTKALMMLCNALLIEHPEGVINIAKRARALGASENEIVETLAVAFLMGGLHGLVAGAKAFQD